MTTYNRTKINAGAALLSASSGGIATAYSYGSTFYADAMSRVVFHAKVVGASPGTAIGNVSFKVRGSFDNSNFEALILTTESTGAAASTAVVAAASAASTWFSFALEHPQGYPGGFQIGVACSGTAGATADTVTVYGAGW